MKRRAAVVGLLVAAVALVCSAQSLFAPSAAAEAAKVLAVSGQVSVLNDSQPWGLNVGDQVRLGQVIVSGPDGLAVFQVSDGSTFEVYANSRVVFRKNPGNLKDLLDVVIGRVKVHIQKWGGQPNHNRVFTPTAVISVRGTVFYVEVEEDQDTTLVFVDEGLVEVQHSYHPGTPKLVGAGEWLRVYRNQPISFSRVDKSSALKAAFRVLSDSLYTVVHRGPRIPTMTGGTTIPGGGGAPLPGDTSGGAPPPPPTIPGDAGSSAPPPPPPGG